MKETMNEHALQDREPPPTVEALEFVAKTLGNVLDEFPSEMRDALTAKFCAEFASPMTREMELVLCKRLTDDEVRHIMFSPTPAQYRHYATLLSLRPAGSVDDVGYPNGVTPLAWPLVLQKRFLTLFYLKHARTWALVVEFVLLDGLQILAEQFLHPDLQIRGQAIDCFVQITSSTAFDWFQDPVGYQAKMLHSKMVALAAPGSGFLTSLVQNIRLYDPKGTSACVGDGDKQQRLPGGTYMMLQVLAFFLSWVRKFYTQPKNELRLSRELLGLLRDWRERTQTQDPAELELAQQVYDDFSRWPAIDQDSQDTGISPASRTDLIAAGDTLLRSRESFFSREEIQRLLDTVNDGANSEDSEAKVIEHCSAAISANVCLLDAHLLRATALAQRVERRAAAKGSASKFTTESYDGVQRCLDDCAAVLRLDEANVSARKLRLRALAALEMWSEALASLDEWVSTENESLAATFLPEDIKFFAEQREVVAEKSRAKAQEEARQQRLGALRLAKQEEIFQAILKRDRVGRPAAARTESVEDAIVPKPRAFKSEDAQSEASNVSAEVADLLKVETTAKPSLLTKFMASSASKSTGKKSSNKPEHVKDPQTEKVRRGRAFARQLRQVASDRDALSDLVVDTPLVTLSDALASALGDDQFLVLFDVLDSLKATSEERTAARAAEALRLLTRSVRAQLVLETAADDNVRERIRSCIDSSEDGAPAPPFALDEAAGDTDTAATGTACA